MAAIGFNSFGISDVAFLVDGQKRVMAPAATIASGQTSALTPNHRIPPGTAVVKRTADGKFYKADNATYGDRNTAPSITTTGHADGNGVIKIVGNHGTISVTTATGSGTEANNATDLNADAAFKAHYIASSAGGELTIAARNPGAAEWFYVHADSRDGAGFAEGTEVRGTDADYRVTADFAELKDLNAVAQDYVVPALKAGHFRTSALYALTSEAREVLIRNGSIFS